MALGRIRSGDTVKAVAGKENGKKGKVIEVIADRDRARVEGMMVHTRHLKKGRSQTMPQGGRIEKNGTIHLSNLMLVCPSCEEPTRVGARSQDDGGKARYCKKCEQAID